MTDNEWKELCDWAEKLGSKRIVVGYNEFVGEKSIYIYSVGVNFFCSDKIGLVIQQAIILKKFFTLLKMQNQ